MAQPVGAVTVRAHRATEPPSHRAAAAAAAHGAAASGGAAGPLSAAMLGAAPHSATHGNNNSIVMSPPMPGQRECLPGGFFAGFARGPRNSITALSQPPLAPPLLSRSPRLVDHEVPQPLFQQHFQQLGSVKFPRAVGR